MRAHRNDVYRARRSRGKAWPVILWILAGLIVLAVILFFAGQKYIVYDSDGSLHVVFPIMETAAPVTESGQPETVDTELVLEDPDYSGIVSDAGKGLTELHGQYLTADKITPDGLTRAASAVKAAGGNALVLQMKAPGGTLSCKHIAWPIKLGVDSPQWTEEQLAEMARENAKGVTYEGRHYTQYEATQQQKALENSIRQCKDRIAAAQEEGKLGSGELRSSRILLRQLNAEYKRFSAAAGLRTAPERLRAAGLGRALKPDGTLEMPRPAGTLTGSGGKLDVEEARKSYSAYLDTLTDAPEKNMVWLRYFTEKNPTEYMEDGTLDAPFAYDPVEDRILYNPRHPQFSTTDFEMANTHELAHRTDVLNAQGYKNKAFVDAISDASKAVLDNAEGFQRVAQAVRSDLMKDILSALSSGRLDTGFGHKAEYWAKNSEAVPLEIFAELFTMETRNDSDLFFVKKLFPGLWKEYQKLF